MRISTIVFSLALGLVAAACARQPEPPVDPVARYTSDATDTDVRFAPVDLFLDTDQALAVYQLELLVKGGDAKIVGVEGGDSDGFSNAPYYDPDALSQGRIVLGAFSTEHVLTRGRRRVATVHMQEAGAVPATYELRLVVAANADGAAVTARPELGGRKGASR
jgi:hypothetical protein